MTVYTVPYDEYVINVYTDGYYLTDITSDTAELLLYIDSFNSSNPSLNLIASNGDYELYASFLTEYYFQSAVTYVLVVAAPNSYSIDPYSLTISGSDRIDMIKINNNPLTTSEPTTSASTPTATANTTIRSGDHSAGICKHTSGNILCIIQ